MPKIVRFYETGGAEVLKIEEYLSWSRVRARFVWRLKPLA